MTHTVPREADFDLAPNLLDGAKNLTMTARDCDLAYWLTAVAQGTLIGRAANGHAEAAPTPDFMREDGPLREALILELGWRSVAEDRATRTLSYFVAQAPGIPEMEFFATQVLDEARHSMVFRNHLVELGVPAERLHETIAELSADYVAEVLTPIEEFVVRTVRDEGDFVGAVAAFTIVVEGVLAPAAELSERKWDRLDPAAGEIARGAGIDEIRHLTVGSSIVREHLIRNPGYRSRVMEIVTEGRKLWDEVPVLKYVLRRENLFQDGMREHAALLDGYEVFPGRKLLETSATERYDIAERWTDEMAEARLHYMKLPEAVSILSTNTRELCRKPLTMPVARLAESRDTEKLQRRHAEYFQHLAERAEPLLRGPAQATWLPELESERDNLSAAMDWAFIRDPDVAVRLTSALAYFWLIGRRRSEVRQRLADAVHTAHGASPANRAKALMWRRC